MMNIPSFEDFASAFAIISFGCAVCTIFMLIFRGAVTYEDRMKKRERELDLLWESLKRDCMRRYMPEEGHNGHCKHTHVEVEEE